jgi:hypothetical protein
MNILIEKLVKLVQRVRRAQRGFTAVETAIGLTAAIVASGAVATVVVSSGTESSQKIDQAVTETMNNLSGTFMIKSDMTGKANITGVHGTLGQIVFNVGLVLNDGRMDFTPPLADPSDSGMAADNSSNAIVICYSDANQRVDNLYWTVKALGKNNGDYILDGGELFQITVGSALAGQNGGNLVDALNPDLTTNTNFVLEMLHAQSPGLSIEQTTPSNLSKVVKLR